MNRFNLPKDKFDKLVRESKRLQPTKCNCEQGSVSVNIHYAFCGPVGVRCECRGCGRVGELQQITEFIGTEGCGGTPVTQRSLIKGIKKAVKQWDAAMAVYNDKKEDKAK